MAEFAEGCRRPRYGALAGQETNTGEGQDIGTGMMSIYSQV